MVEAGPILVEEYGFRVLGVDAPGFGGSPRLPDSAYQMGALVELARLSARRARPRARRLERFFLGRHPRRSLCRCAPRARRRPCSRRRGLPRSVARPRRLARRSTRALAEPAGLALPQLGRGPRCCASGLPALVSGAGGIRSIRVSGGQRRGGLGRRARCLRRRDVRNRPLTAFERPRAAGRNRAADPVARSHGAAEGERAPERAGASALPRMSRRPRFA